MLLLWLCRGISVTIWYLNNYRLFQSWAVILSPWWVSWAGSLYLIYTFIYHVLFFCSHWFLSFLHELESCCCFLWLMVFLEPFLFQGVTECYKLLVIVLLASPWLSVISHSDMMSVRMPLYSQSLRSYSLQNQICAGLQVLGLCHTPSAAEKRYGKIPIYTWLSMWPSIRGGPV